MLRSASIRIVPWLLLALLGGCGGADTGPRLLGTFPLHAAADLPDLPPEASIVEDPELGPALCVETDRLVRVPVVETDLVPLHADSLGVGGRFRTELLAAAVNWQLRLEDADGGVRVLTTSIDSYVRTHGWEPVRAAFGLGDGATPVRATLSILAPPGRVWVEKLELWDGPPPAGTTP